MKIYLMLGIAPTIMEAGKPKNLPGESGRWRPGELMVNSSLKVNRHNTQEEPTFQLEFTGRTKSHTSQFEGRKNSPDSGQGQPLCLHSQPLPPSPLPFTENRQDIGTSLPKSTLALKGRQGGMTSQRFPKVSNLPPRPKEVVSDYRVLWG